MSLREFIQRAAMLPFYLRQRKLARQRRPMSQADFVRDIVSAGGDPVAASAIWKELQEWIFANDFSPDPGDDLASLFGLAEDELDDVLCTILRGEGIRIPEPFETTRIYAPNTPLGVSRFVASCRELLHLPVKR